MTSLRASKPVSALPAKLVLGASTLLLVGVVVALASGTQTQRSSDLSGGATRRTNSSSFSGPRSSFTQTVRSSGPQAELPSGSSAAALNPSARGSTWFPFNRFSLDRSISDGSFSGGLAQGPGPWAKPVEESGSPVSSVPEAPKSEARALPLRISIPSLDVLAPVVPVGIEPDQSMEIPDASEAGWYRLGPQPGGTFGSSVIAGHVDSKGQEGVFVDLRRLKLGAEVFVTDADGTRHRFEVSERYQVDKEELPTAELFRVTGDPVLTLITCGGRFSNSRHSYSDNIVVRAVPAPLTFDYVKQIFAVRS